MLETSLPLLSILLLIIIIKRFTSKNTCPPLKTSCSLPQSVNDIPILYSVILQNLQILFMVDVILKILDKNILIYSPVTK